MDDSAGVLWILLALILVGSGLLARRMPMAKIVTWALGWVVLFFAVFLLFRMIEPEIARLRQAQRGGSVVTGSTPPRADHASQATAAISSGGAVTVPVSSDGHYWVDALVNGQTVRFLIDSGASTTALSDSTAVRLGLPPDPMNAPVSMETANGTVEARRSVIGSMQVGTIQATDLPVVISPAFGEMNVLGMNFLGKLRSWRVESGQMKMEAE